ncbi:MAG: hypothetical protein ACRENF_00380, partial [Thermodesulfobacteriota bacterium]
KRKRISGVIVTQVPGATPLKTGEAKSTDEEFKRVFIFLSTSATVDRGVFRVTKYRWLTPVGSAEIIWTPALEICETKSKVLNPI